MKILQPMLLRRYSLWLKIWRQCYVPKSNLAKVFSSLYREGKHSFKNVPRIVTLIRNTINILRRWRKGWFYFGIEREKKYGWRNYTQPRGEHKFFVGREKSNEYNYSPLKLF